ncbi:hypothetical protein NBRC116495_01490 [Aurantivibrio plasticivorans]
MFHPNSFRANIEVGKYAASHGNYEEARNWFEQAYKLKPNEIGAKLVQVMTYCDQPSLENIDLGGVVDSVRGKPLGIYGLSVLNNINLKLVRGQCGSIDKSFVVDVADVVSRRGLNEYQYRVLAQSYLVGGDYAKASSYYRLAFELQPEIGLVFELVDGDIRFGNYSAGLDVVNKAIEQVVYKNRFEKIALVDLQKRLTKYVVEKGEKGG